VVIVFAYLNSILVVPVLREVLHDKRPAICHLNQQDLSSSHTHAGCSLHRSTRWATIGSLCGSPAIISARMRCREVIRATAVVSLRGFRRLINSGQMKIGGRSWLVGRSPPNINDLGLLEFPLHRWLSGLGFFYLPPFYPPPFCRSSCVRAPPLLSMALV